MGSESTHKNSVRRVLLEIATQTLLSTLINVTLNLSSHALPRRLIRNENVQAARLGLKSITNIRACFWVTSHQYQQIYPSVSSSLPFTRVLLGYLTNGCLRERQNLLLSWFGREQTLTFLADLCAATTGTLSNNPYDPNQEAEDGLYLFCTFWVITFHFSGLERQLGAAKHSKPNVR